MQEMFNRFMTCAGFLGTLLGLGLVPSSCASGDGDEDKKTLGSGGAAASGGSGGALTSGAAGASGSMALSTGGTADAASGVGGSSGTEGEDAGPVTCEPHGAYPPPPDGAPLGTSYGDWVAGFWQWMTSLPSTDHPLYGGPCEQGQGDDAWFLPPGNNLIQPDGSLAEAQHRNCTIPATAAIVAVPAASWCPDTVDTDPASCAVATCVTFDSLEELKAWCWNNKDYSAPDLELSVEVDGVSACAEQYYARTEDMFTLDPYAPDPWPNECVLETPPNNCGSPVGPRRALAQGVVVGIEPLSPGEHTIRIRRSEPSTVTDVTYHITVL
jgi:hypothetical protein